MLKISLSLSLSASQSNPCSKQTFAVDRDSPASGLTLPTLSVRHGLITTILPVARSVIFDLSIVSALAQQPMQLQAHAHVSRLPPACLLQVQLSKSGALLQAREAATPGWLRHGREKSLQSALRVCKVITITVWCRVCAAGQCNIAERHMRGFAWLQVLSPSALDYPVDIRALVASGLPP